MSYRNLNNIVAKEAFYWGNEANSSYFDIAEKEIDNQWQKIYPFFSSYDLDHSCVLDLAAGKGRFTAKLVEYFDKVVAVDVNRENIYALKKRFCNEGKVTVIQNNGYDLSRIDDNSVSFIYSFDAMVHFDIEIIISYIKEFCRTLKPKGYGFIHHSNYTENPGGDFMQNPHCRNFMSKELFAHLCIINDLSILKQKVIDWGIKNLDCVSLFQKETTGSHPG